MNSIETPVYSIGYFNLKIALLNRFAFDGFSFISRLYQYRRTQTPMQRLLQDFRISGLYGMCVGYLPVVQRLILRILSSSLVFDDYYPGGK